MSTLAEHEQALLRSQSGPLAGTPFSAAPSTWLTRIESHLFRVLFLRRLRPSHHVSVDVAVLWTPLATIALRVREQGFWDDGGLQSRVWQRASAEKEGPEWRPTSWCETWILGRPMCTMAGASKLWPTHCLFLEVGNWRSTPLWCPRCIVTGRQDVTQPPWTELCLGGTKKQGVDVPLLVAPRARARLVVWAGEVNGRRSQETRVFEFAGQSKSPIRNSGLRG